MHSTRHKAFICVAGGTPAASFVSLINRTTSSLSSDSHCTANFASSSFDGTERTPDAGGREKRGRYSSPLCEEVGRPARGGLCVAYPEAPPPLPSPRACGDELG